MLYFILLICRGGGIGRHDRLKICCSLSVGVQVPLPIPHGGKMSKKYDIVVLSGGFDPPHIGHARMIRGASDIAENFVGGGYVNTTSAVTGLQFSMSSGNIDAGTFKLIGHRT